MLALLFLLNTLNIVWDGLLVAGIYQSFVVGVRIYGGNPFYMFVFVACHFRNFSGIVQEVVC